jgi:hypothetical protein
MEVRAAAASVYPSLGEYFPQDPPLLQCHTLPHASQPTKPAGATAAAQ